MLVGLIVMQLFPEQLIGMFDADAASAELLVIGIPALRTICLSFLFAGYCIVVGSVFQALGNGVYSMCVSIARQLFVLLPVAWLFSLSGNVNLIWWAFPIAELVSVGMSTFFLVRIYKKIIKNIGANVWGKGNSPLEIQDFQCPGFLLDCFLDSVSILFFHINTYS